jgi:hypothetical protein
MRQIPVMTSRLKTWLFASFSCFSEWALIFLFFFLGYNKHISLRDLPLLADAVLITLGVGWETSDFIAPFHATLRPAPFIGAFSADGRMVLIFVVLQVLLHLTGAANKCAGKPDGTACSKKCYKLDCSSKWSRCLKQKCVRPKDQHHPPVRGECANKRSGAQCRVKGCNKIGCFPPYAKCNKNGVCKQGKVTEGNMFIIA